jgi:hypothetical protein
MLPVRNPKTGAEFQPGQNTSPNFPANPVSPETGMQKGIETMRPDSVGP